MHTKAERTVLISISKRKLHLIPIAIPDRTWFNAFKYIIRLLILTYVNFVKDLFHLIFFDEEDTEKVDAKADETEE